MGFFDKFTEVIKKVTNTVKDVVKTAEHVSQTTEGLGSVRSVVGDLSRKFSSIAPSGARKAINSIISSASDTSDYMRVVDKVKKEAEKLGKKTLSDISGAVARVSSFVSTPGGLNMNYPDLEEAVSAAENDGDLLLNRDAATLKTYYDEHKQLDSYEDVELETEGSDFRKFDQINAAMLKALNPDAPAHMALKIAPNFTVPNGANWDGGLPSSWWADYINITTSIAGIVDAANAAMVPSKMLLRRIVPRGIDFVLGMVDNITISDPIITSFTDAGMYRIRVLPFKGRIWNSRSSAAGSDFVSVTDPLKITLTLGTEVIVIEPTDCNEDGLSIDRYVAKGIGLTVDITGAANAGVNGYCVQVRALCEQQTSIDSTKLSGLITNSKNNDAELRSDFLHMCCMLVNYDAHRIRKHGGQSIFSPVHDKLIAAGASDSVTANTSIKTLIFPTFWINEFWDDPNSALEIYRHDYMQALEMLYIQMKNDVDYQMQDYDY
jgi:hypothetical protein